jgi:peptide/nickel transport system ATP-binding protein
VLPPLRTTGDFAVMAGAAPIVTVERVSKTFGLRRGAVPHVAVDDVSFQVQQGEVLGIVGQSGSGKTSLARMILRLTPPTSGQIVVDGIDIWHAGPARRKCLPRIIQAVFQDPYSSLDPRIRIGQTIAEGAARVDGRAKAFAAVDGLLELVSLPTSCRDLHPHQLSGGQRQRVAIARALAMRPKVLVADEPVSSLDVSMQGQVLNLLCKLQRELSLTCIFISHDLGIVQQLCERVLVMEKGKIVEEGTPQDVFASPAHPYTRSLIAAIPRMPV